MWWWGLLSRSQADEPIGKPDTACCHGNRTRQLSWALAALCDPLAELISRNFHAICKKIKKTNKQIRSCIIKL